MAVLYLIMAIILLIFGHIIKSLRWKQLISTYENVEASQLMLVTAASQAINMVIPFRVGDVFRGWYIGKNNLDNGYVLAFASVIIDIFIDIITVGMAFTSLYALGIHKSEIRIIAAHYGALSVAVIALCVLIIIFKKYVKVLIGKVASIFNDRIEQRMLMTTYTIFASAKDVFKRQNIFKIAFYTTSIWVCYFFSYGIFAVFLQERGYDFTLTSVFKTIFSLSGDALFIECFRMKENTVLVWVAWYLTIPLVLLTLLMVCYMKSGHGASLPHKSSRIIPQINETEKLAFLSIYFEDSNRDYFDSYLSINKDVSVLQDCSAGSNATTIIAMDGDTTFYRKYAFGNDAIKLNEQIEWLEAWVSELPLCHILRKYNKNGICYYDMEYINNALGFFQYIHTTSLEHSWNILNQVLDILNTRLYSKTIRSEKNSVMLEYIEKKVMDNIQICNQWCKKYYSNLFNSDTIWINGIEYQNLRHYNKFLNMDYLSEVFSNDIYATIHGDLTIENIVCLQGKGEGWYLIDPNTGSMHESPFLDYAKLLQSLHGKYEFLMKVKDVSVTGNHVEYLFTGSMAYQKIYEKYKAYLFQNFSYKQVKSIFYHETVHWLRLMPYKIRKNPKSAVIFYAGMLMVLSDVEAMFGQKRD